MTSALLLEDPRFLAHRPPVSGGGYHPERPERLEAARAAIEACSTKYDIAFSAVAPRPATDEELARAHDPRFVEALRKLRGQDGYIDADTFVGPESVATAELAAGGTVALVDALIDGPVKRGI